MEIIKLTPKEQAAYFEGLTCGLDEGRRNQEAFSRAYEQQYQTLWTIIFGLRHDFTWSLPTRSNRASNSVAPGQGVAL